MTETTQTPALSFEHAMEHLTKMNMLAAQVQGMDHDESTAQFSKTLDAANVVSARMLRDVAGTGMPGWTDLDAEKMFIETSHQLAGVSASRVIHRRLTAAAYLYVAKSLEECS